MKKVEKHENGVMSNIQKKKDIGNLCKIPTKNYDLLNFEDLEGIRTNYGSKAAGNGCLTIIDHPKDGTRLLVANNIWRDLGCPQYIRPILIDGDLILLVGTDINVAVKFNKTMDFDDAVANYKSKIVLYASKTAKRLVAEWGLTTEEGKKHCSFTGGKYSMVTIKGEKAAAIVFPHEVVEEEVKEVVTEDIAITSSIDSDSGDTTAVVEE